MRLLFVCLGNICRSPTGEAVMRELARREGLADMVIDSAGTAAWHTGKSPDSRSAAAAAARGIDLTGAARQVKRQDFIDFDLLLAADEQNVKDLQAVAPHPEAARKIVLLRSFDPEAVRAGTLAVPDPYFGGPRGFDQVLDVVESACAGLITQLREDGRLAEASR